MRQKLSCSLITFLIIASFFYQTNAISIDRVVIWGHKLHSHTHSYIHAAFYKAFTFIGYETYWLDEQDDIKTLNLTNTLFITEGQVDQKIPLSESSYYVLHNCNQERYQPLIDAGRCLMIQVYTDPAITPDLTKLDDYIYFDLPKKILYFPWASDLLPHEIDEQKKIYKNTQSKNHIFWIGSIWNGPFGNKTEIDDFIQACTEKNIHFKHLKHISDIENIHAIHHSLISPAIQGAWQCEKGYIPCRIFKNISYGALGITNSKTVYELFQKKIVYNNNTYQLFFDACERLKTITPAEQFELMDFVKEKHTYLNRIQHIFYALNSIS